MTLRRSRVAVDSHDTGPLRRAVRRTRLIRVALAAAAIALLAAAAASARGLDIHQRSILPSRSTGVVVLDLSLSILDKDYAVLHGTLQRLIDADAPVGLVVFSDVPYELLPPGTPARELRPLLRLLIPRGGTPPRNPWNQGFRSGTRISAAIALAREMLERERVEQGSILVVSDLQTAPDDVPQLTRTLRGLRLASIDVRVVPLSAGSDGRLLFEQLLGPDAFDEPEYRADGRLAPVRREGRGTLPTGLLALGGLVFLALAAHERFAGRLGLPRPKRPEAGRA